MQPETSATSEAGLEGLQENAVQEGTPGQETRPAATSEGTPSEGTGATAAKPDEGLSIEEQVRRAVQSRLDKVAHEAELRAERRLREEMERRQQQQAMEQMSDEQLGRYVRENQRVQAVVQQQQREWMERVLREQENALLKSIQDAKVREDLKERADRGEFQSFEDYLHAMQEAAVASREAKLRETIREAVKRELNPQKAASSATQLGAGIPGKMNYDDLPTQEKLRLGFEIALKEAQEGG